MDLRLFQYFVHASFMVSLPKVRLKTSEIFKFIFLKNLINFHVVLPLKSIVLEFLNNIFNYFLNITTAANINLIIANVRRI